MTPLFLYILLPSILVTSFISGIFGMAGGMIMMGIIAWFMPISAAMVLHGFVQMVSNGWRAFLHRQHIQFQIIKYYLCGLALALSFFMMLQLTVDKGLFFIFLGVMPFLQYLLPKNMDLNIERPWHSFSAGAIFTSFQLLSGTSGPIVDLYFIKTSFNRHQIVATKALTQAIGHIVKIFYFGVFLGLQGDSLALSIYLMALIAAIAGTTISSFVLHRMTDNQFRKWSYNLISIIALIYLARGINEYLPFTSHSF